MNDLMKSTRYLVCLTLTLGSLAAVQGQEKNPAQAKPEPVEVRTDFSEVPEGWLVGLDRAKEQAAAANRDLLLNFSGSDWIPPSIELEERVFTQKAFIDAAMKDFVLVRLDSPRKRNIQSDALREKNEKAAAFYEITALPTIVLADSKGRPYAKVGYMPSLTPESFLKLLAEKQELRKARDTSFAAAAQAEGVAKVSHLAKALEGQSPNQILRYYRTEFNEIVALDPKNAGGLNAVVYYEKTIELRKKLDKLADENKWEEAIAALDVFSAAHAKTDLQKQKIEYFKLNGMLQLKQLDDIMPFLDRIIAMGPDSPVGKKAAEVKPQLMERIKNLMLQEDRDAKKKAESEVKAEK